MEKFTQFIISDCIEFFKARVKKAYHIKCVNELGYIPEDPCLFLGNYNPIDTERINNHKGLAFVIWEGRDVQRVDRIKETKRDAFHLVDSPWIKEELEKYGIKPLWVPFFLGDIDYYKPCPLGNKVYAYTHNPAFNIKLLEEVKEVIPYEIFVAPSPLLYSTAQLQEIYKQCFINLHLVSFDGMSTTVQELGLMGRKSVWNGNTPSAIRWNNLEDIRKAVIQESRLIGTIQHEVADKTYKYLKQGCDWMKQEF